MPRIEQVLQKGEKFKKSKVRSWDDDLVGSLKLASEVANQSKDGSEKEKKREKPLKKDQKATHNKDKKPLSDVANKTKKSEKKDSTNTALEEPKERIEEPPSFLDDNFKYKKIISRLSGHESKLLYAVLKICESKSSLKTGNIPSDDFDNYLGINRNSRETALKRLCKKGLIKRNQGKRGLRGTINLSFVSDLVMKITKDLTNQE